MVCVINRNNDDVRMTFSEQNPIRNNRKIKKRVKKKQLCSSQYVTKVNENNNIESVYERAFKRILSLYNLFDCFRHIQRKIVT